MIDVYVWAQTTYETNRCRGCDTRLRKANGMPKWSTVDKQKYFKDSLNDGIYMFCRKCGKCCGEIRPARNIRDAMRMKDAEGWKQ